MCPHLRLLPPDGTVLHFTSLLYDVGLSTTLYYRYNYCSFYMLLTREQRPRLLLHPLPPSTTTMPTIVSTHTTHLPFQISNSGTAAPVAGAPAYGSDEDAPYVYPTVEMLRPKFPSLKVLHATAHTWFSHHETADYRTVHDSLG
jgi:hypothetical protein